MHEVRWLASPRQGGKSKSKSKSKSKNKKQKQKAKAKSKSKSKSNRFFMMPEGKALPFAAKS